MTRTHATRSYGTVSIEQQRSMSGLAFVRGLADGSLPLNTIARTLGYEIAEAENGRIVITATPTDALLNPAGTVHGGFTATLLDSCMGLAIQSTLEAGNGQTTLEFKISLARPITPETGLIRAEGTVLSRGRRVGTAEGRVDVNLSPMGCVIPRNPPRYVAVVSLPRQPFELPLTSHQGRAAGGP